MLVLLRWGLRHERLVVKAYTLACLAWLGLLIIAAPAAAESPSKLTSYLAVALLLGVPPLAPLYLIKRRESRARRPPPLDPYLISAREKLAAIDKYFKGQVEVTWSPVVSLAHDVLMSLAQRMLIDLKGAEGVKALE